MCAKAGIKLVLGLCVHTLKHIHIYIYMYTYIYTHIYTHRCIYIYTELYFFKIFMQSKPFPSTPIYFCYIIAVLDFEELPRCSLHRSNP